jgi:hypothetical protein
VRALLFKGKHFREKENLGQEARQATCHVEVFGEPN